MRKQKVSLNKFERMLLESKFPTLRILLEKDDALDSLFGGGDEGGGEDKAAADTKEETGGDDKGGEDSGGGLDDLFGGGEDSGGEEGGDKEGEDGEEGEGEETEEGGEDAEKESEEDSKASQDDKKEKEQEAIEKAAKTSANIYKNVVGDAIQPGNDEFNKALFGSRSLEMQESYRVRKQKNRIQENISRYLFKNINMRQLSRKKNLSLNNFEINEHQLLKVNRVINEATSVDEIINNKFWEENATVDLIVDNAINLTRHFEDLIDIPKLIMNSVAIKFGKQAAQESGDNKNSENEYKLKLDEFLQKYATALKQLPDYENYDTSRVVFDASKPDVAATGAFNPGG